MASKEIRQAQASLLEEQFRLSVVRDAFTTATANVDRAAGVLKALGGKPVELELPADANATVREGATRAKAAELRQQD